ncbi:MAG: DUF1552 domain-containing protein [Myxococcales bacterium]|nr:DUF1552 domain-containing protein [Myxococcales bacterium]
MNAKSISRRTVLRGLVAGSAVAIGLPTLDRFCNGNGTAWAETGSDGFPKRFGLFFWGNGMLPARWVPKSAGVGAAWQLSDQLQPLAKHKARIAVVTGTRLGLLNSQPHGAGAAGILSGRPLLHQGGDTTFAGPSIDQIIADFIGKDTRFRSLEFGAAAGNGYSYNGPNSQNPPESNPFLLFERVFGLGFTMPGEKPKFDPSLGLRRSVLDAVSGDIKQLRATVGAADAQRLDQHFEGVRQLEKRLAKLELAPPKLDACKVPKAPEKAYPDIEGRPQLQLKNKVLCDLAAYALACDQTRVVSNFFTMPVNNLLFKDATTGHHELTHNEPGAQDEVHAITLQCVEAFAYQIESLAAVTEGATTLLDHCALMGCSEVSLGKTHSLEEMPLIIAGSAGGKLKNDVHYRSEGSENTSKALLSLCRAVGCDMASFGAEGGKVNDGLAGIEA